MRSAQAFSTEAHSAPGQVRVEARSNEIAAPPVAARGGDHALALKGDRGTPFEDAKLLLDTPAQAGKGLSYRDVDGAHGRIETRVDSVAHDIA